jgi:hypothetical protein
VAITALPGKSGCHFARRVVECEPALKEGALLAKKERVSMIAHLIGSAFRGFFRILLASLFFIAIGVGVSLLVAYQVTRVWPPSIPEYIIAGAIGLLLGYAAGLTTLLREAIRGVKTVERDVAAGVEQVEERVTQA